MYCLGRTCFICEAGGFSEAIVTVNAHLLSPLFGYLTLVVDVTLVSQYHLFNVRGCMLRRQKGLIQMKGYMLASHYVWFNLVSLVRKYFLVEHTSSMFLIQFLMFSNDFSLVMS